LKNYNLLKSRQIEKRVYETAQYIIEKKATVRECAKQFGVSKSTVHPDILNRNMNGIFTSKTNITYSSLYVRNYMKAIFIFKIAV